MVEAVTFAVGENVLATDSGLLYDAKVLKAKHPERGEPTYFIHFNKWNSRWDKWVTAPNLRKQTDENREMQRKMKEEADAAKVEAQSKRKLDRVKEPKPKVPKAKKPRILDNDLVRAPSTHRARSVGLTRDRAQEDDSDQPQIKITLTQTHKRLLVDDWQAGDLRSVRGS